MSALRLSLMVVRLRSSERSLRTILSSCRGRWMVRRPRRGCWGPPGDMTTPGLHQGASWAMLGELLKEALTKGC